jgi:replicative DNA helicase
MRKSSITDLKPLPIALNELEVDLKSKGEHPDLPLLSMEDLSYKLWGLHKAKMYVIGARTSNCKSMFVINIAYDLAKQGKKVVFLSLEMPCKKIVERMFCLDQEVNNEHLFANGYNKDPEIRKKFEAFRASNLRFNFVISDCIGKDWHFIDKIFSSLQTKPDIVILDHVQEIRGNDQKQAIDEYISKIRESAIRNNFAAVLCSQVNRISQADRENKEPSLHHLKSTGFLEECVSEDTLIYNIEEDKNYTIKEIYEKQLYFPIKMVDTKTARITYEKPNKIFDNGFLDCYKVTTESGKEIVVSDTARFYDGEWKRIKELNVGDKIYVDF